MITFEIWFGILESPFEKKLLHITSKGITGIQRDMTAVMIQYKSIRGVTLDR